MRTYLFIVLLVAIVLVPLALRPRGEAVGRADRTLVIITPHNEATRYEFGRAFAEYFLKKTGQHVLVDWRTPGGTSEISRYLASEYLASFENLWSNKLHRDWNATVRGAFDNPTVKSGDASPAEIARKTFLESNAGCGI